MASNRKRDILSPQQARDIFKAKADRVPSALTVHSLSTVLAERYQISSKAVRDIWTGRSWLHATFDLWEADDRPSRRRVGRPKGKKDSKPRKTKPAELSKGPLVPTICIPCLIDAQDQHFDSRTQATEQNTQAAGKTLIRDITGLAFRSPIFTDLPLPMPLHHDLQRRVPTPRCATVWPTGQPLTSSPLNESFALGGLHQLLCPTITSHPCNQNILMHHTVLRQVMNAPALPSLQLQLHAANFEMLAYAFNGISY